MKYFCLWKYFCQNISVDRNIYIRRSILLKDVIARYNIKYKDLLEKLSLFVASNFSKSVSLYALNKQYDAGINTIKNYLNYLEKSFLFVALSRYDFSLKKQQYSPHKYYGIDIALLDAINFKISEDFGRKIENICLIELLNRGRRVYYHKDDFECDFLVLEGMKVVQAIQVCSAVNASNQKRELRGLREAMNKHKISEGIILTSDQEGEIDGIPMIPLWKWLIR